MQRTMVEPMFWKKTTRRLVVLLDSTCFRQLTSLSLILPRCTKLDRKNNDLIHGSSRALILTWLRKGFVHTLISMAKTAKTELHINFTTGPHLPSLGT
jgi:hypothetical protein